MRIHLPMALAALALAGCSDGRDSGDWRPLAGSEYGYDLPQALRDGVRGDRPRREPVGRQGQGWVGGRNPTDAP